MSSRPKIAFFDFTSCEGCQLTVIDSLQDHPELLDAVEIIQFREAMSEKGEDYLIAFIEGSCTRPGDEEKLKAIREQAAIVVALGACAHLGGINTIRNQQNLTFVRNYVYGDKADWYDTYEARPISAVIKVDTVIAGCPIDRDDFLNSVKMLLQGRIPQLQDSPLCIECKLNENVCVYLRGKVCLGPIISAGYGDGCEGCRGMIPNPNIDALKQVMSEHGLDDDAIETKMTMFLTYQLKESEYSK